MASLTLTGMCFWRWGCYSKFRWVLCISFFHCSKPIFALHVNEIFLVIFQLTNGSTMRSREETPAGTNMEMWLHSFHCFHLISTHHRQERMNRTDWMNIVVTFYLFFFFVLFLLLQLHCMLLLLRDCGPLEKFRSCESTFMLFHHLCCSP